MNKKIYDKKPTNHNWKDWKASNISICKNCDFVILRTDDGKWYSGIKSFEEVVSCRTYSTFNKMNDALS